MVITRDARKTFSALGRALVFIATKTTLLQNSGVLNNVNTVKRQERVTELVKSLSDISGHQGEELFSWCKNIDELAKNSFAGTHVVKDFAMDNLPVLWKSLVDDREIVQTFYPFICHGFEKLCKQTSESIKKTN